MDSLDAGNAIERWQTTEFGKFDGLTTLGGAMLITTAATSTAPAPPTTGKRKDSAKARSIFLNIAPKLNEPFCLFVSLVNPHDVWVYPSAWQEAGYRRDTFANLGIALPPNYADDLSTKPKVQKASRDSFEKFSPLATSAAREEYVNFYAYLNMLADKHVAKVLDTLDETGLTDRTVVIRLADHGEGGLSHGMREKSYTVYEEMIHIPLIVDNPRLFPEPGQTNAFYDHLDLLPTTLDPAGVPKPDSYGVGSSIVPVIREPSRSVRDHTAFSFDDRFFLRELSKETHIRAIRSDEWTYAAYFSTDGSGIEYELYNLTSDPLQLKNLLYGTPASDVRREWSRLSEILTKSFIDAGNLPNSFAWPIAPAST